MVGVCSESVCVRAIALSDSKFPFTVELLQDVSHRSSLLISTNVKGRRAYRHVHRGHCEGSLRALLLHCKSV